MGGDFAPEEAIKGVKAFFDSSTDRSIHLILIGEETAAAPFMHMVADYKDRYTFVHAPEIIEMHEHPTKALKEKPNSSISIGFGLLMKGMADAFISAGNTGAMLVGTMYTVKPVDGVMRPSIASPIPRVDGKYNLLLDVGINADCKPENLVQFAQLGTLYSKHVMGTENPRVGLLNIGEEEGKGNVLAQNTYPLLKEHPGINFVGNVEGRDIFLDKADVIVCEGFVGNVTMKMAESIYDIFVGQKGFKDPFLDDFNFESYGGTPVLGVNSPVLIGHGISKQEAFKNILELARKQVSSNLCGLFKENFKKADNA